MATFANVTLTAWFEGVPNMRLANRTRIPFARKGIATPSELFDFKDLVMTYVNLCKPPKIMGYCTIEDRNNGNGVLVNQTPYLISVKLELRLNIALLVVKYYKMVGQTLGLAPRNVLIVRNYGVFYTDTTLCHIFQRL